MSANAPTTNPEKILLLTVGLPRSGKSTWARQQRSPIVNPDAIRLGLHGQPFIGEAEPFVWAIAKTMARALFHAGHRTVILDATNTTRARRADWVSRSWKRYFVTFGERDLGATTAPWFTPDYLRELHERAAEQYRDNLPQREGLQAAIDRMASQYEPVGFDELAEWEQPGMLWQMPDVPCQAAWDWGTTASDRRVIEDDGQIEP